MLSPSKYLVAVNLTQIVSIDLIVKNEKGKILLGRRRNRPAQGYYFVPGGRVYKNETLQDGLKRVIRDELGECEYEAKFRCVSDHMYDDNFLGAKDEHDNLVKMHYVCIGMDVMVSNLEEDVFKIQHEDVVWLSEQDLLNRDDVHKYTKYYFQHDAPNRI